MRINMLKKFFQSSDSAKNLEETRSPGEARASEKTVQSIEEKFSRKKFNYLNFGSE